MKTLITLISTLTLGLSGMAAVAQDDMSAPTDLPNFADADSNGDGYLNSEELSAAGVEITIEEVDTNDDSLISRMEYQQLVNAQSQG